MNVRHWFRTFRSKLLPDDGNALHATLPGESVIGTQIASARAPQQRHDEANGHLTSPLFDFRYTGLESRTWRWIEAPVDRSIETQVEKFAGSADVARDALRDELSMDDFYTLLTFARRSAYDALRSGEIGQIEPAFNALAMISLERIDWRDFLVASRLVRFAGQHLQAPVSYLVSRAARLAEPHTAQLLEEDSTARIDLAKACGKREVCTSDGLALFDTGFERFSPDADLAQVGFECAMSLQEEGYEIETIEVASDIPLVWLNTSKGSAVAKMVRKVTGCVTLHGVPRADPAPQSSGQSLLVFLAEAASASDAREIVAAAERPLSPTETQFGHSAGRLCAVIIQRSWMANTPPLEDMRSLERLRTVFDRLLAQK